MSPQGIKRLRKRLGLTQEQFGAVVYADRVTVARWERNTSRPRGAYLRALEQLAEKAKKKGSVRK